MVTLLLTLVTNQPQVKRNINNSCNRDIIPLLNKGVNMNSETKGMIDGDDQGLDFLGIHGAGGGISEGGNVANGFTGAIAPDWDL